MYKFTFLSKRKQQNDLGYTIMSGREFKQLNNTQLRRL